MANFRFGSGDLPTSEDKKHPIDAMIDAAGGSPLPGKFGVVQALLTIWTSERFGHPALHVTRNLLNSAGVLRTYRRSLDPTRSEKKEDPIKEYISARKLVLPEDLEQLGHFIHVYSEGSPSQVDLEIGTSDKKRIRTFKTVSGVEYTYTFAYFSEENNSLGGVWFSGKGPYLRPQDVEAFRREVSELIWTKEGNSDIQLSCSQDEYGYSQFSVSNIGRPDDYVSEGASQTWVSVSKLADRCKAFQSKKLSRKILFYGPPGTGKSTLARNLAREVGAGHTLRIEASAVEGAGTNRVMQFVRFLKPRVILFDDLDRCQNTTEEILHYMEQVGDTRTKTGEVWAEGVLVVGTVNSLGELDPAMLRPGRFDEVLEVTEPCDEHRMSIIQHYLKKFDLPRELSEGDLPGRMKGFSPADIREILTCISTVGQEYLDVELNRVQMQRSLYAGAKVSDFLSARNSDRGGRKAHP